MGRYTKKRPPVRSKKTTYDGVEFQSMLEVNMYKLLKKANIPFEYEPTSYILLENFSYKGECYERAQKRSASMRDTKGMNVKPMTYKPDFVDPDERWVIETKGRKLAGFSLRWKIFKDSLNTWDKPPILFLPTNLKDCNQVIECLIEKGFNK